MPRAPEEGKHVDPTVIQQTLQLLKQAQANPLRKDATTQGISSSTGLLYYSLEAAAKLLYPVLTPLRNSIPRKGRVNAGSGTAEHWKAITAINPGNYFAGVSEGNRGAVIDVTEKDYTRPYVGLGLENSVTFEAEYGGEGFDDERGFASLSLLQALMIAEEKMILTGNGSLALGTAPTPTVIQVSTSASGISAGTTNAVAVVALTEDGYQRATSTGVVPTFTKTNADGTTDTVNGGTSQISPLSSQATTDSSHTQLTASCTAVAGAFGYAWYFSASNSLSTAYFVGVTRVNTITLTANPVNTNQAGNATGLNADHSANSLAFDGLMTQAIQGGGYNVSLNGATLTASGNGSIVEWDTALKYFWDNYRISPTQIRVGSQVLKDANKKILSGSTNPVYRIQLEAGAGQKSALAGSMVRSYLNPFALGGAKEIPIELHPNMPDGATFFDLDVVPYPNANTPVARRIRTRQDYYQIDWPRKTRKYEMGVYADEMVQVYVPFGMGVITNILPG